MSREEPTILDGSGEAHGRECEPASPPTAPPGVLTGAQSVGPAGSSPGEGSPVATDLGGAELPAVEGEQCVTASGAVEGLPSPVEAAPEPDAPKGAVATLTEALARLGTTVTIDKTKPQPELVDIPVLGTVSGPDAKVRVINVPEPPRVPRYQPDERPLPISGAAQSKPLPSMAAIAAVARKALPDHLSLVPVGDIAIDERANVIAGPKGEWQTHRPCVLIVKRLASLAPGSFLDATTLASGGMSRGRILESVPTWTRELAAIGIELGRKADLFYLKRMEA